MPDYPRTYILGKYAREEEKLISSQISAVSQKVGQAPPIEDIPFLSFSNSTEFWNAVRSGDIRDGTNVRLVGFNISDWLPRWPGLWVLPQSAEARRNASKQLFRPNDWRIERWRERKPLLFERFEGMSIYTSDGKEKMLDGGTGCVRLAEYCKSGSQKFLCNAFRSSALEAGVPIEVGRADFDSLVDEIYGAGSASGRTVEGTVRDAPNHYRDSYERGTRRVVLEASNILHDKARRDWPIVSVPISFVNEEDYPQVMVSFASFRASDDNSYEHACEFLREVYVGALYDGFILTDFDEKQGNFDDAALSLKKISTGSVDDHQVRRSVDRALGGGYWRQEIERISIQIGQMEALVKEEYNVSKSQNVAIKSQNVTQNAGDLSSEGNADLQSLVSVIKAAKGEIADEDYSELLKNANAVVEEAQKEAPNKDFIDIFLGNITRKAKGIVGLAEKLIPLANKIGAMF